MRVLPCLEWVARSFPPLAGEEECCRNRNAEEKSGDNIPPAVSLQRQDQAERRHADGDH